MHRLNFRMQTITMYQVSFLLVLIGLSVGKKAAELQIKTEVSRGVCNHAQICPRVKTSDKSNFVPRWPAEPTMSLTNCHADLGEDSRHIPDFLASGVLKPMRLARCRLTQLWVGYRTKDHGPLGKSPFDMNPLPKLKSGQKPTNLHVY